jgi:hypothetical protein
MIFEDTYFSHGHDRWRNDTTGAKLVDDPDEAAAMAYAMKPHYDEYLANASVFTSEQIFQLGQKIGEAAVRAQAQYNSDKLASDEAAGVDPVPVTKTELRSFAAEHGYTPAFASRTWGGLMRGEAFYDNKPTHPSTRIITKLRQFAADNGGALDARAIKDLVTHIVENSGYAKELNNPTIGSVGVKSIAFLVDYVNSKFELEGDERIVFGRDS